MKLIVEGGLYPLLYAACTYAADVYPSERINEYIIVNDILPPNIRRDSNQPEIWRDYQQVLAELGLMYSTKVTRRIITPTPSGLTLLDNKDRYKEILTCQALLYQYPNGNKTRDAQSQIINNNVLIRPAVLIWRVIALLREEGENPSLSSTEIRDYLMRCCAHADAVECTSYILNFRRNTGHLPQNTTDNSGRNATDWIALLTSTLLFTLSNHTGSRKAISLSNYAIANFQELDQLMKDLEKEESFWRSTVLNVDAKKTWYSFYGASRLDIILPPDSSEEDEAGLEAHADEREVGFSNVGSVTLSDFNASRLNSIHTNNGRRVGNIETSYDAGMVANRHRLHDSMVIYIANLCSNKGAQVFEDPKSVDLLIRHENTEYLIEVKTITPRNYVKRLRYAVGQLLHYDFMLEPQLPNRRRVLAMPTILPNSPAFIPFFNGHLDIDLLTLVPTGKGQVIRCDSSHAQSKQLFSAV